MIQYLVLFTFLFKKVIILLEIKYFDFSFEKISNSIIITYLFVCINIKT